MKIDILVPSGGLGLILVALYLLRCYHNACDFQVGLLVKCVLNGSALVCGALLIAGGLYNPILDALKEIDQYIIVGGIALTGVTIQEIWKDLRLPRLVRRGK